jgi:uncharacterized protein
VKRWSRAAAFLMVVAVGSASAATPEVELFRAVAVDNVGAVQRQLAAGFDHGTVDPRGDTLLIVAIRNDASRVAELLIADPKTNLEATNAAGETALMMAAYRKRRDLVEKLIDRDAEVNRTGWTALHYAASVDARDVVAVLLDHAAYIDAESPNKTTPLMMAARGGFGDLCRQLIDAGADPTPVNERDLTASDFAKRADDQPLADWLAERAVAWRAKYGVPAARPSPETRP